MKKNRTQNYIHTQAGFTLVEVMVSITLFTVVAVVGITAVLSAKSGYEKGQSLRTVTDSLMFVMEDISRTARLGNYYRCVNTTGGNVQSVDLNSIEIPLDSQSGVSCDGFAFEPFWNPGLGADGQGDPEDQLIYVFAEDEDGVGALYTRSLDDNTPGGTVSVLDPQYFQRLTPKNLSIDLSRSGFDVVGAETFEGQPRVLFRIHAILEERNQETEIALQTTISQRAIRIE